MSLIHFLNRQSTFPRAQNSQQIYSRRPAEDIRDKRHIQRPRRSVLRQELGEIVLARTRIRECLQKPRWHFTVKNKFHYLEEKLCIPRKQFRLNRRYDYHITTSTGHLGETKTTHCKQPHYYRKDLWQSFRKRYGNRVMALLRPSQIVLSGVLPCSTTNIPSEFSETDLTKSVLPRHSSRISWCDWTLRKAAVVSKHFRDN